MMTEDQTMLVTFYIAGEPYRLRINSEDEELIRKAAKEVDKRYGIYCERFEDNSLSDVKTMSMVAFHFAFESLKAKNENEVEAAHDRIKTVISDIDSFFVED
ncbi:MAG: cell division protein ZapA [Bacteroidales bacterium]